MVIRSGTTKKRLLPNTKANISSGDVIEFLPGQLPYRLNFALPTDGFPILSSLCNNVQSRGSLNDVLIEDCGGPSSSDLKLQENEATGVVQNQEIFETMVETFDQEEQFKRKRKRQLQDDEAFARALQVNFFLTFFVCNRITEKLFIAFWLFCLQHLPCSVSV